MIFNDRLEYLDQCIAGEKTQFDLLLSKEFFNTVDRGYDLYRDYIKQKSSITDVHCKVFEDEIVLELNSDKELEEIVSENMPKKGITPTKTDTGVNLHIKLIDLVTL